MSVHPHFAKDITRPIVCNITRPAIRYSTQTLARTAKNSRNKNDSWFPKISTVQCSIYKIMIDVECGPIQNRGHRLEN